MKNVFKKLINWVNDANHWEIDRNLIGNFRNVRK